MEKQIKNTSKYFCLLILILCTSKISAQNLISYNGDRNYTLVERTDLSRYDNGKYRGLISREVRSFITRSQSPVGVSTAAKMNYWYDGNFYVTEQTVSSSKEVYKGIHDSIPSVFNISPDGQLTMVIDNGFPSFRSFPAFPREKLKIGDTWQAQAFRAIDPLNKGIITRLPMQVAYTFAGEEKYHEIPVYKITAKWATRYDERHLDFQGDSSLVKATGTHEANIFVNKMTGTAILIHDRVDETFMYNDGLSIRLKGTISQFTEYPPSVEHKALLPALQRIAKISTSTQESVANTAVPAPIIASSKTKTSSDSSKPETKPSTSTSAISFADSNKGTQSSSLSSQSAKTSSPQPVTEPNPPVKTSTKKATAPVVASAEKIEPDFNLPPDINQQSNSSSNKKDSGVQKVITEKISDEDIQASMLVEETPAGLRLSVRNVQFKADSADVLQDEVSRLNQIADVLKLAPNSHFLIEGYSASVGNPRGEQSLSEERARSIAEQLAKRGIPQDSFICRGHGSENPIASNATAQGRAQNRRVEITILE